MKKKLCFLSDESVLAGSARTGVSEVVDSLACALSKDYETSVVCKFGGGAIAGLTTGADSGAITKRRLFGTDYYMITPSEWGHSVPEVIDTVAPDILHNFSSANWVFYLNQRIDRMIYTIDDLKYVTHPDALSYYDAVTTVSNGYAAELLHSPIAHILEAVPFKGITNGIMSELFAPEQKILIDAAFSADDLSGKQTCKLALCRKCGIDPERTVFAMACRMTKVKGVDQVIDALPLIDDLGGVVLFYGVGEYDERLKKVGRGGKWVPFETHPARVIPILAGADFLLSPSLHEPCGLMPMTACRYGTIPITTLVGGLADNMDEDISIPVNGSLESAIRKTFALSEDERQSMRRACMKRDFSWDTRKDGYIELYEASVHSL